MSNLVQDTRFLRLVLLHYYNRKKTDCQQTPKSHVIDSKTRKLAAIRGKAVRRRKEIFPWELVIQRQKRKGFLPLLVTDDEKWIHFIMTTL